MQQESNNCDLDGISTTLDDINNELEAWTNTGDLTYTLNSSIVNITNRNYDIQDAIASQDGGTEETISSLFQKVLEILTDAVNQESKNFN